MHPDQWRQSVSIASISLYFGIANNASFQDRDWLDQQVSDFFAELAGHNIQSTDEDKALGYLALRWMSERLGLIS
jgi:hypothetical protein